MSKKVELSTIIKLPITALTDVQLNDQINRYLHFLKDANEYIKLFGKQSKGARPFKFHIHKDVTMYRSLIAENNERCDRYLESSVPIRKG